MSLIVVQVNLIEKQFIYTNYDYLVGKNFVGKNYSSGEIFVYRSLSLYKVLLDTVVNFPFSTKLPLPPSTTEDS